MNRDEFDRLERDAQRVPCPDCGGELRIAMKPGPLDDGQPGYVVAHVFPTCEVFRLAMRLARDGQFDGRFVVKAS